MRLSLWVHTPLVLYYLCRELRRECGYTSELLSLPFLKLRLSRLYEAIDWQACAWHAHGVCMCMRMCVCMCMCVCMACAWRAWRVHDVCMVRGHRCVDGRNAPTAAFTMAILTMADGRGARRCGRPRDCAKGAQPHALSLGRQAVAHVRGVVHAGASLLTMATRLLTMARVRGAVQARAALLPDLLFTMATFTLHLLWQVLRDHQTIYEPPALPSRLQAEFGEMQFEKQPEDTRRHALPPLVGTVREGTQEDGDGWHLPGVGALSASARAPAPAPARESMASEVMALLNRVFGAAPQGGCSGRRSGPDPVAP